MYFSDKSIKVLFRSSFALLVIYIAFLLFVGTLSFNPNDPSYNNAVSYDKIYNLSGKYGAFIIDPYLQFFGFSGLIYGFILFCFGLNLIFKSNAKHFFLKLLSFLCLLVTLPGFLTIFPVPEKYISNSGGGYVGQLIYKITIQYIDSVIFYPLFGFLSLLFISISLGITLSGIKNFFIKLFVLCAYIVRKLQFRKNSNNEIDIDEGIIIIEDNKKEDFVTGHSANISIPKKKNIISKNPTKAANQESAFIFPETKLLKKPGISTAKISQATLQTHLSQLEQVLVDFRIKGEIIDVKPGPVVTLFELEPAAGTKSSRIIGLSDDIARSMSALSARIAVIPGKNLIGIELPNKIRETVYLRELLESSAYVSCDYKIPLALGKDIGGGPIIADLTKMPHLLVAGTTGSGKSVAINTMILSILYKLSPEECKFIMIDPKMLELSVYDGIPHLLSPVVTDPAKAIVALKWVVKEMENRYRLMSSVGVRNIHGFNEKIAEAKKSGKKLTSRTQTGFDPETGKPIFEVQEIPLTSIPLIVVIVDEMADLMLVAGKDIESSIQRLAQMARAAGIHIIMATQRPSVDVITGVIKANFPTRISFQVTSKIDSRTILGEQGAEQLLGMGDMLYMAGGGKVTRVHGPFVSDGEVEKVVSLLKSQGTPNYIEDITISDDAENDESFKIDNSGDELYDQAVQIVIRDNKASTSYIQRCLKIGYNRAASIIERMEKEGIVSAANHVGKREILANKK